jgi:transposase
MPRIAEQAGPVTGGVDTHGDVHVAAVVDRVGRVLGAQAVPADTSGYAGGWPECAHTANWPRWGWRAPGSYGCGLARHLASDEFRPYRRS